MEELRRGQRRVPVAVFEAQRREVGPDQGPLPVATVARAFYCGRGLEHVRADARGERTAARALQGAIVEARARHGALHDTTEQEQGAGHAPVPVRIPAPGDV